MQSKVLSSSHGFGDGLIVHIPPTNTWGEKFRVVGLPYLGLDQNTGYLLRVQTLNISTTLNMSDGRVIEIKPEAESFFEADVTGNEVISFTSNQPVMVVQYIQSDNASSGGLAMLTIPPVTQYGHNVTFPVF